MTAPGTPAADPTEALRLLWRTAPRRGERGPQRKHTTESIVQTAIELTDREGLPALTMRKLAQELGMGVASLYTYVPGHTALLAVMLDHVIGETRLPTDLTGDWRAKLAACARSEWEAYLIRPWLLQLTTVQPPLLGPNLLAWYEAMLTVTDETGLPPAEQVAVIESLDGYVRGSARAAADQALEAELDWSNTHERFLADHVDWATYPKFAAATRSGAFDDPRAQFHLGLERLLDGVSAAVEAARSGEPASRAALDDA